MSSSLAQAGDVSVSLIGASLRSGLSRLSPREQVHLNLAGHPIHLLTGDASLEPMLLSTLNRHSAPLPGLAPLQIVLHTFRSAPEIARLIAPAQGADEHEVLVYEDQEWSLVVQRGGAAISCVDWDQNTAYWIVRDPRCLSYIDRAAPLTHLLALWFARHGKILTHAACVGLNGEGVLIVGKGGAGKSTTSLLCMNDGFEFVSDDHCLVSTAPIATAHSLYGSAKICEDGFDGLEGLKAVPQLTGRPTGEKVILLLNRSRDTQLTTHLRLRAIFRAQITNNERTSRLRPMSQADAFKVLAASCALHVPSERKNAIHHFSQLSRQVPAYTLELGSELERVPEVVRDYLVEAK